MRQVANPTEHDVLLSVLNLSPCTVTESARFIGKSDVAAITSILDDWAKEGILEKVKDIYTLPIGNSLALRNELLRYRATLPPQGFSLDDIAPEAADAYRNWLAMVENFRAGHIPEKDHKLYLDGIRVLAVGAINKFDQISQRLFATDVAISELITHIDETMSGLVSVQKKAAPDAAPPASGEKK
ncbi:MAG: hypothetical protein A3A28_05335 [Candidatus Sungbacteria bacterium RIFCSPLOWO2_01_FULL_47_32]|uniref:Uncharacterized protein n=1 Tax=Candidatus Sungbacteria bacterium RIFCSPHIGHO2_01_FULL_47_32 TaxID=1802264 RepID=A0A1G2K3A6_9BACT|nr:MAG: hypothetical protein UX72_C0001G0156 [Parcubacteria group bacterium GW2011_GWA2_47_10]OGZ93897.1 MAG: hypothetical protein A2633_05275 [Candidatus Sungbacteria bacterium RIFCSPHIGHO2_01_FULL_47_32]OGZ99149.1 MAG: hypothetical protein A3D57_05325 [Candidatus Sungbacteria bacterium RIFCSPHIGHO2_02_FULL_46_12]OHA06025.1 MAG: hypothetical protein A3A28_05335 [Candidatus Sungbacteria bacterium RIFCSPLOWO2_01_FULL_47_32]